MLKYLLATLLILFLTCQTSQNSFAQWSQVLEVGKSKCILSFDSIVLVGTDHDICRSTDAGTSWSHIPLDTPAESVTDLSKSKDYIFAGTMNSVYVSADSGKTWTYTGPLGTILSVYAQDSIVLACIHGGGLYRSSNNGQSWAPVDGNHYYEYIVHDTTLFVCTFTGIYSSRDMGLTWNLRGLERHMLNHLTCNDNFFFTSGHKYILRSSNDGISWDTSNNNIPEGELIYASVFAHDKFIYAASGTNKVFMSSDDGVTWRNYSEGITIADTTHRSLFSVCENKLFVSFWMNSLWQRDISQPVNVGNLENTIPKNHRLHQNFPNPFNPSTTITFSIPTSEFVSLKLYTALGQEIATLVSGNLGAGTYSKEWNASQYASGVYFYRLHSGEYTETKRLLLLK